MYLGIMEILVEYEGNLYGIGTTGQGHGESGGREAEAALRDGDRCGVVADAREGAGGRDVVL